MTKSISAKYLGVNGAEERQKEDYYATDPNAVKDLIRKLLFRIRLLRVP